MGGESYPSFSLGAIDAYLFPLLGRRLELDNAIDEGEEGVVTPHAHVAAGADACAALANNDGASAHVLPAVALYPQSL